MSLSPSAASTVQEFRPGLTFPGQVNTPQKQIAQTKVAAVKEVSSHRIRALPTVLINSQNPIRVCGPNPNRLAVILRVQTPTGYVTIGGAPDDGPPATGGAGAQYSGLPLHPYETLTLETTGEVWAIADLSYSTTPSTWLRVLEIISPVSDQ